MAIIFEDIVVNKDPIILKKDDGIRSNSTPNSEDDNFDNGDLNDNQE